jgi:ElaB/YqjD/DUF883 family membrane-anchored ribosome-binding protein
MKQQSTLSTQELESLAADAQALLSATAEVAGEQVAEARKRLAGALDRAKEAWGHVQDRAVQGAKATDVCIRDHPYQAIGLAFGAGALLGFLLTRKG